MLKPALADEPEAFSASPRDALGRQPRMDSIFITSLSLRAISPMSPTRMTEALYAYLMTRPAVHAAPPANLLSFPLDSAVCPVHRAGNYCSCARGRQLMTMRKKRGDGIAAPIWSRGWRIAAPAIPRAMHLPGAERASASFAGGDVDQLDCPMRSMRAARRRRCRGIRRRFQLSSLRAGDPDHGVARGPMAEVVSNLSMRSDESDVHAIAAYMTSVFGSPTPDQIRRGNEVRWRKPSQP